MKSLKISLASMLTAIILTISTGVYAYEGENVDPDNKIEMPGSLSNGKATVTVSELEGDMKYQFIEIEQSKYEAIKKYEDQIELMKAYKKGKETSWSDSQAKSEYNALEKKYETTYNEKVSEVYSKYSNIDDNSISEVKKAWKGELPDYDDSKWKDSSNNKISLNITKFNETKYCIAWVKIGDVLDAEVYVVEGAGKTKTSNDTDNTSLLTSDSKDTTASTTGQSLPKTGIGDTILALIAVTGTSAGYSFKKYRKIK